MIIHNELIANIRVIIRGLSYNSSDNLKDKSVNVFLIRQFCDFISKEFQSEL